MKYRVVISYDGSKFYGFQRLNKKPTVQKSLEDSLSKLDKRKVVVKGAGRTDRGVHASGQCVHFELNHEIPTDNLMAALNKMLFPYIRVLMCEVVSDDFHARFSVIKKQYTYKIWLGAYEPTLHDYYLQYQRDLNLKKLKKCAKLMIGGYNFHNFVSGERENYNAIISNIKIKKKKNVVTITFLGKSFYRYMVRNLVGAMIDYNEGRCNLDLIRRMLLDENFHYQLRTVSANGLYLDHIFYEK